MTGIRTHALPGIGKGCYLWKRNNLFNGDLEKTIRHFVAAKVQHVCIKVADGRYCYPEHDPGLIELAVALKSVGINVGAWAYEYLRWTPIDEAIAVARGVNLIGAQYLLHDIEDRSAFFQWVNASRYIRKVEELIPDIPMGMNSYWKPSWHSEIPYSKIRAVSDFDAPQIYSRGDDPVRKFEESKREFAKLWPQLPFSLPAGDMYFEGGIKPNPGDVTAFMQRARMDLDCKGVVMWSADQRETTPELWAEFTAFDWETGYSNPITVDPVKPPIVEPLYAAVLDSRTWHLTVRSQPNPNASVVRYLDKSDRITVYLVDGDWAMIDMQQEGPSQWVSAKRLKKV